MTDEIEKAFREGYSEGYRNGGDDSSRFEWGGGSNSIAGQKRDEDEAWNNSDTKQELDKVGKIDSLGKE